MHNSILLWTEAVLDFYFMITALFFSLPFLYTYLYFQCFISENETSKRKLYVPYSEARFQKDVKNVVLMGKYTFIIV